MDRCSLEDPEWGRIYPVGFFEGGKLRDWRSSQYVDLPNERGGTIVSRAPYLGLAGLTIEYLKL